MVKTRSTTRRNQLRLVSLPEELIACVLDPLDVAGLARAAAVSVQLRTIAATLAQARWRRSRRGDDQSADRRHPNVMRALWTDECLAASAGEEYLRCTLAQLFSRFRHDWPALNQAQQMMAFCLELEEPLTPVQIHFFTPPSLDYWDSGPGQIAAQVEIEYFKTSIQWAVDHIGWSRELAEAYVLLFNNSRGACGAGIRGTTFPYGPDGPNEWTISRDIFAASAHLMCHALRTAAVRGWAHEPTVCPPPAYANLQGDWSLVSCDPAWERLLLGRRGDGSDPPVEAGLTFVTSAVTGADVASAHTFPNGRGIHVPITYDDGADGHTCFELQDGPIVEFISRPASSEGFHALVQTANVRANVAYDFPPFATVTLEAVLEPGKWRANGKRVQQRCFRVSVTYG